MNTEKNKQMFETLLQQINRPGMEELIEFIRQSDFYSAPASSRFHLSAKGGLLQHSLNVFNAMYGMLRNNGDGFYSYLCNNVEIAKISKESVIIVSLLHDICKVNTYCTEKRNRKNSNGEWEQYDFYTVDEKFPYGHGEKSVLIISNYINLLPVEQMAIRWHMGFPDDFAGKTAYGSAVEKYPIILALNNADMLASRVMEDKESNKPNFV